jgi:hypothetical protein
MSKTSTMSRQFSIIVFLRRPTHSGPGDSDLDRFVAEEEPVFLNRFPHVEKESTPREVSA